MYAKIIDGNVAEYPINNIKKLFPNTSFREVIPRKVLSTGYVFVYPVSRPAETPFTKVVESTPVLDTVSNKWTQQWVVVNLTQEELTSRKPQIITRYKQIIQKRLDNKSAEREYDGIVTLCTYATDPDVKQAKEGQDGVNWRSATWSKYYAILAQIDNGERDILTEAEFIAELPDLKWFDEA